MRPEEAHRTLWATLFYFFFVAHVVMIKSAANALFLSRHNPLNLPYLYISVAALVAVIVLFASNVLADPRRRKLRLASLATVALVLVLSWALLFFHILKVSPFVYLFAEVAATALNIQFWSVAGDIFDPQEGKRVFGILAGGGMSGSIFGGLFVHELGPVVGTVNLMLTAAASLVASLVAAWVLTRHQGRADTMVDKPAPKLHQGLKYVFGHPYPRTFGLLMMLAMVITSFVDYLFRTSARQMLGEDQLAVLFGDLNMWIGLISVVFLFLFANRILKRVGIFYYLLLVPVGMTLAAVASIFAPVFLMIYALKIVESSGSMSINQAALQLMYNPVPTNLRASSRGVIDGLMRKLGYAVGGLALLVLAPHLGHPSWQIIIIVLVLVFCVVLFKLRKLYVDTLFKRLQVGAHGPVVLRLEEANSKRALMRGLDSDDEELVITSLKLLSRSGSVRIEEQLHELLDHPSERVRIATMEAIGTLGLKDFLFELLAEINSGTRRCRVAAVKAMVALDPSASGNALVPYLRSEEPGLVAAAIENLLKLNGYTADNPAVAVLESILEKGSSATPAQRRETARLLGGLGESRYSIHLNTYLSDPDPSVRKIAANSARLVKRMDLIPRLLNLLSDREVRRAAMDALAEYGDQALDILEQWLNDLNKPLSVRLRLPRLIRMIGTKRAGEVLLFSNIQDHAILRYRIAMALSGIRSSHNVEFDKRWALQAVDRRLDSYRYYSSLYEKLAKYLPPKALVLRALRDRLEQNLEVTFRVLGLVYPHRTLMSIHHRFNNPTRETLDDALELLDNVIDRESRDRLLPILERHHDLLCTVPNPEHEFSLEPIRQEIEQLCLSKDVLMSATAVHTRCKMGDSCEELYPELFEGESTMDVMEKVLFLESVDIFRQNNLDDLTALAAITREKQFEPGESILVEGEPGDALYIITEGEAEIRKGSRKLLTVGLRASLGGVSLLDQKPHAASAVCTSSCSTLKIDRMDFMDLVSDRVELLHGIFLALTDRLRALLAVTEGGGLSEQESEYDDGPTNPV